MPQEMITGRQMYELTGWATRLPSQAFQDRRLWLERITNPSFNMDVLANVLMPTTFGSELKSPFDGAMLVADGPGDDEFDITRLKLVNILTDTDPEYITMEEAVRRGQANPGLNWGQRLAFRLRDAGNAGKVDVWPVGVYAICSKTIWQFRSGIQYAWYVIRDENGFRCDWNWFDNLVNRSSRFPSLAE